jgi:ribosomal protein L20
MDKILEIEQELIEASPENIQSISYLMEIGGRIAGYIAFTGSEVAKAKRVLLNAKKAAYFKTMEQLKKEGKDVAPSLVKDYVGTMVAKEEERYLLCDRMNAACTHQLTFINVCISALKTEMQTINFHNK